MAITTKIETYLGWEIFKDQRDYNSFVQVVYWAEKNGENLQSLSLPLLKQKINNAA